MFYSHERSRLPDHRGVTLLESIIVMGIMIIILGVTHSFLASGVGFYLGSVQGLQVQQQALVGMTRMMDEMENSVYDKINIETVPSTAVTFPSLYSVNGNYGTNAKGDPLYQSFVCYMMAVSPNGEEIIQRKVEGIIPPVDFPPDPLSPPDLGSQRNQAYFAPRPPAGIIARNVQDFTITPLTDALEIELTIAFTKRSTDTMTVNGKVVPRNG